MMLPVPAVTPVVVHAQPSMLQPVLLAAAVGSVAVLLLAGAAFARRRSWSYALVTLALATLLARTAVGVLSVRGVVPVDAHHTLEHGLDVVMAGLVVAAVWMARSARDGGGGGERA